MKQQVAFAIESARTALHRYALVAAIFVAAKFRQMVEVHVNVTRNEKIHVAIAIIIAPRGAGTEAAAAHTRLIRYILKFTTAQVAIKSITVISGDVEIQLAVIVEIRDRHTHAPAATSEPGIAGDVFELSVRLLVVQRDQRIAALAKIINGGSVDENDIEAAVIVTVKESDSAAHGLDDVAFLFRGNMRDGQANFSGDFFKYRDRREIGARFLCGGLSDLC